MNTPYPTSAAWPRAVLFDLLTALLDSWTVWNAAAGSEAAGRDWRAEYLRLTYGCGAYQPYEDLVRTAARNRACPRRWPTGWRRNGSSCSPGMAHASCWPPCARTAAWPW